MISLFEGRWSIVCGGCLARLEDRAGTRSEVVEAITGPPSLWEMQEGDMCRCLDCSRRAREVANPVGVRGRRRR